jgi:hypothetical protein
MKNAWIYFITAQATIFAVDVICELINPGLAIYIWILTLGVGILSVFIIGSARIFHPGALRFLAKIVAVLFISSIFWLLVVWLFVKLHAEGDPSYVVAMLIFWIPSLAFWSAGWYAWLILGLFIEEKK